MEFENANKRKLVTVKKITALSPIPQKDLIEVATVGGGWPVVVKKGEFKVNDLCVYFEIDSFLPDGNPTWQFLVDKSSRVMNDKRGHKLRTIKLGGQVSQGLALPLNAVPLVELEVQKFDKFNNEALFEMDFSEMLGVEKYEAPLPAELAGQAAGLFPSFIRKTDQERCQNLKSEIFGHESFTKQVSEWFDATVTLPKDGDTILGRNAEGKEWSEVWDTSEPIGAMTSWAYAIVVPAYDTSKHEYEVSLKLDGSSMTVFHRDGEIGVCSRNLQLKMDGANSENTFVKVFTTSGLAAAIPSLGNIAIQGELMGPGIQGNRENLSSFKFFIFDVFFIDEGRYGTPAERKAVFQKLKDLNVDCPGMVDHVPVLHENFTLGLGICDTESLLKFAEGPSLNNPIREGLVFKRVDGNFSFKAISNLFLMKTND